MCKKNNKIIIIIITIKFNQKKNINITAFREKTKKSDKENKIIKYPKHISSFSSWGTCKGNTTKKKSPPCICHFHLKNIFMGANESTPRNNAVNDSTFVPPIGDYDNFDILKHAENPAYG